MDSYGVFQIGDYLVSSWGLALWAIIMITLAYITGKARSRSVGFLVFIVLSLVLNWLWSSSTLWFIVK